MNKMIITLVLEGSDSQLTAIKEAIVTRASRNIVNVTVNEVEEVKEIKCDMI